MINTTGKKPITKAEARMDDMLFSEESKVKTLQRIKDNNEHGFNKTEARMKKEMNKMNDEIDEVKNQIKNREKENK